MPDEGKTSVMHWDPSADDASCSSDAAYIPRYAMPNISSVLPTYSNSEQEFIFRTFSTGNYDQIRHLPHTLKEEEINTARAARIEAARKFLMPGLGKPVVSSRKPNQQGLFSVFEYIPSRYSMVDELNSQARLTSETKRMEIAGQEFLPTSSRLLAKYEELEPGRTYPYVSEPAENLDRGDKEQGWGADQAHSGRAPFIPSGHFKVTDKPTKSDTWQMMHNLKKWIEQDWEYTEVTIFENDSDCWVICFPEASIDSRQGLAAYMNVFIRCNTGVCHYGLTKVVEFWDATPADGNVYFVLRPPWVKVPQVETFLTLYPNENHWSTGIVAQSLNRSEQANVPAPTEDVNREAIALTLPRLPKLQTQSPLARVSHKQPPGAHKELLARNTQPAVTS